MTTATSEPDVLVSAPAPGPGLLAQVGPWLGYAGCFVGAGLVSGGVVHHPLDPGRYTVLAAVGALAFLVAALGGELLGDGERPPRGQLLRIAGGSLLLALGIGMLSGGIQHFRDVPDRAVVLVPAGLLLSWLAFRLRAGTGLRALVVSRTTGGVAALALGLFLGLPLVAGDAPAGGHGHGATAVPAADGHTAEVARPGTDHAVPAQADTAHADPASSSTPSGPVPAADLDGVMAELEKQMAELAGS